MRLTIDSGPMRNQSCCSGGPYRRGVTLLQADAANPSIPTLDKTDFGPPAAPQGTSVSATKLSGRGF